MKVLVIGSGAREHCLAWKLSSSPRVTRVFCAPGNPGTGQVAQNVPIAPEDREALTTFAREEAIDLTVVGPEAPLVNGMSDEFASLGLPVFGPSKAAARVEGSKAWAKELMLRAGVPTASSQTFENVIAARDFALAQAYPLVVKADGLAAGKGVTIAHSPAEALDALELAMVKRVFGAAGDRVLIEEYLYGPEVSLLAISDGTTAVPLLPACDYKRVYDGDGGPNTGGMGAYCPTKNLPAEAVNNVMDSIIRPVIETLAREGTPYVGVLYAGLVMTSAGPKVMEFNCRFGDPETQVVLPLLASDLAELALLAVGGRLSEARVRWHPGFCCGIVLSSGGYPGPYHTGLPVNGLDAVNKDCLVFHAGTRMADGRVVTAGGRVLTVVATGSTMAAARTKAYLNASGITFSGMHARTDIALRESD